ncbi:MAG: hypothetical protein M1828_001968 [Chrysothrix sp. TS-e1954]|nr:MAG: hypothetical protein M1828_001968 [Chrysothrix sp. TS-e1954]
MSQPKKKQQPKPSGSMQPRDPSRSRSQSPARSTSPGPSNKSRPQSPARSESSGASRMPVSTGSTPAGPDFRNQPLLQPSDVRALEIARAVQRVIRFLPPGSAPPAPAPPVQTRGKRYINVVTDLQRELEKARDKLRKSAERLLGLKERLRKLKKRLDEREVPVRERDEEIDQERNSTVDDTYHRLIIVENTMDKIEEVDKSYGKTDGHTILRQTNVETEVACDLLKEWGRDSYLAAKNWVNY